MTSAFVVGFAGTCVIAETAAGRSDTAEIVQAALVLLGVLCGVIGAAAGAPMEAVVAGTLGVTAALLLLEPELQAIRLGFLWGILVLPFLLGFGLAALVDHAVLLAGRRRRVSAGLAGAVIIVALLGGLTMLGGPRALSTEQASSAYTTLDLQASFHATSISAQLDGAAGDPVKLGAAYRACALYDAEFGALVRSVRFPETARLRVDALSAAVDDRARVCRSLAGDPLDAVLRAELSAAREAVAAAMVELGSVLGVSPTGPRCSSFP